MEITTHNLRSLHVALETRFNTALQLEDSDSIEFLSMLSEVDEVEAEYPMLGTDLVINDDWQGSRELQRLREHGFTIVEKLPNGGFRMKVPLIETDKIGSYKDAATNLGDSARRHPSKLIGRMIKDGHVNKCYDAQYFFDTDHPMAGGAYSNDLGGSATPWYMFDARSSIKPFIRQVRKEFALKMMGDKTDEIVFADNEVRVGIDGAMAVGYGLWQRALKSSQLPTRANIASAIAKMAGVRRDNNEPAGVTPNVLLCHPDQLLDFQDLVKAVNEVDGKRVKIEVVQSLWCY